MAVLVQGMAAGLPDPDAIQSEGCAFQLNESHIPCNDSVYQKKKKNETSEKKKGIF